MSYKFINGKKMFFENGKLSYSNNKDNIFGVLAAVYDPSDGKLSYSDEYEKVANYIGRGNRKPAFSSI